MRSKRPTRSSESIFWVHWTDLNQIKEEGPRRIFRERQTGGEPCYVVETPRSQARFANSRQAIEAFTFSVEFAIRKICTSEERRRAVKLYTCSTHRRKTCTRSSLRRILLGLLPAPAAAILSACRRFAAQLYFAAARDAARSSLRPVKTPLSS